jgi:hypothetical protein
MIFKILISAIGRKVQVNPNTVEYITEGSHPAGAVLHFTSGKMVTIRTTVEETLDILEGNRTLE